MKVIAFFLLIVTVVSIAGCDGGYRQDIDTIQIAQKIETVVDSNFTNLNDNSTLILRLGEQGKVDLVNEYTIGYNSDNYDEYGIIKTSSETDANEVALGIINYYFPMKEELMKNYNPDLYEKIDKATCHCLGVYVLYTILSINDSKNALDVTKKALKEKVD